MLFSNVAIVSSLANGINCTINPPACSTSNSLHTTISSEPSSLVIFLSTSIFLVKTPSETTEGVCSDKAK